MRYLKSINEYNREYSNDNQMEVYDSILRDLKTIFGKNMNYIDEPTMPYKELYNMLVSIKHRSEKLLDDIQSGNVQWVESTGSSLDDLEEDLKDTSNNCYQFSRSKRNLEELKELM